MPPKNLFFEILHIFALRPLLSLGRDYKLIFIFGADVLAKVQGISKKKSFFRGISQFFRIVRFSAHTKVNVHGLA